MSFQLPNTRQVSSSEQVSFHCKRCGACCRHVRESVPLNTLDAYRIAKYLRSRGEHIDCLDTVFARYTEPVPLHESGFTVFMLNTTGPDDTCIFLKDNRCTIQQAKPTALPALSLCGGACARWRLQIPAEYGAVSSFQGRTG